jgi:glycosyltransferase involved in cell wall biosynthesis
MQRVEAPGILRGEELARAYASMDVFVFPSSTDTFGNVVLEAMASSVPAIVTPNGGPKFLVSPGETGMIAERPEDFAKALLNLRADAARFSEMRVRARQAAECFSWDAVFEEVHQRYEICFREEMNRARPSSLALSPS